MLYPALSRQREPENLVLRHSVLINTLPFAIFHRIQETLLIGETKCNALPSYQTEEMNISFLRVEIEPTTYDVYGAITCI